jgi:cytochrome c553
MRKQAIATAAIIAAVVCLPLPAAAQDVKAGARKAVACQACHGPDGMSRLPEAPNLAGQPAIYLERALLAYRSGQRRNEVMSIAAKALSDVDVRDLAAYFAAIQIEVKALPK